MAHTARARKGRTRETERTENREEAAVEGKEGKRASERERARFIQSFQEKLRANFVKSSTPRELSKTRECYDAT